MSVPYARPHLPSIMFSQKQDLQMYIRRGDRQSLWTELYVFLSMTSAFRSRRSDQYKGAIPPIHTQEGYRGIVPGGQRRLAPKGMRAGAC